MSLKTRNTRVQAAKCQSLVYKYGEGKKPQDTQAIDGDNEDALFEAGEFGDSNPVALLRTVWWFFPYTSVYEPEAKAGLY